MINDAKQKEKIFIIFGRIPQTVTVVASGEKTKETKIPGGKEAFFLACNGLYWIFWSCAFINLRGKKRPSLYGFVEGHHGAHKPPWNSYPQMYMYTYSLLRREGL